MKKKIVIIGIGGHAISVTNVAISCGMSIIAYVDDNKADMRILGIPVITKQQCLTAYPNANFAIAIGDNSVRERVYNEYLLEFPNSSFPTLIHRSSVIGVGTVIGNGTVVMPLSHIGPNSSVGDFCILNTKSSIDHNCSMKSFSSLAPGVVCGGNVKVGLRSAVSIGAVVKHGIVLGDDVVVGANSYVNKLIEDNVVAYGTPCKKVRTRNKGDVYLA